VWLREVEAAFSDYLNSPLIEPAARPLQHGEQVYDGFPHRKLAFLERDLIADLPAQQVAASLPRRPER
jgi:hypothetical protein